MVQGETVVNTGNVGSVSATPLLSVRGLRKYFPVKSERIVGAHLQVQAVDGVSFDIVEGETLGIVGESGCGKSTTARLLMRLITPDAGDVTFAGKPLGGPAGMSLRDLRRQMQMVFQDSYASLNPRLSVQDSIAFGPRAHGVARQQAVDKALELLSLVGLDPHQFGRRYPHELSGGQRQRVNVARALALDPRLVILDEAVSALDKSIEAQVLNLLMDLKTNLQLTYLFISHDLNVVQYISDHVLVMYLGKVVEVGGVEDIYHRPRHPYTRALLASRPSMDPDIKLERLPLTGDPPNPINPPSGCRFRTRCDFAEGVCEKAEPALAAGGAAGYGVACHMHIAGSGHSKQSQMRQP